jgi:hypothetical protein
VLLIGVNCLATPIDLGLLFGPSFSGHLCVDPVIAVAAVTAPGGGGCISGSEAVVGPFGCAGCPPVDLCAQFATFAGTVRVSTACVIDT